MWPTLAHAASSPHFILSSPLAACCMDPCPFKTTELPPFLPSSRDNYCCGFTGICLVLKKEVKTNEPGCELNLQ